MSLSLVDVDGDGSAPFTVVARQVVLVAIRASVEARGVAVFKVDFVERELLVGFVGSGQRRTVVESEVLVGVGVLERAVVLQDKADGGAILVIDEHFIVFNRELTELELGPRSHGDTVEGLVGGDQRGQERDSGNGELHVVIDWIDDG